MDLVLVKLGGSLITRKEADRSARKSRLRRLARELAEARRRTGAFVLLGHGSGGFGHRAAAQARLQRGLRTARQLHGVGLTQLRARQLHEIVLGCLSEARAGPFSLSPSSFLLLRDGSPVRVFGDAAAEALLRGLLPVLYGDVVADLARGVAVCSTEIALAALGRALRSRGFRLVRAVWLGDTDGVYDRRGRTVPVLTPAVWKKLRPAVGQSPAADVTGGMAHRVEIALELSRLGVESWILDGRQEGTLYDALLGTRRGGTAVLPSKGGSGPPSRP